MNIVGILEIVSILSAIYLLFVSVNSLFSFSYPLVMYLKNKLLVSDSIRSKDYNTLTYLQIIVNASISLCMLFSARSILELYIYVMFVTLFVGKRNTYGSNQNFLTEMLLFLVNCVIFSSSGKVYDDVCTLIISVFIIISTLTTNIVCLNLALEYFLVSLTGNVHMLQKHYYVQLSYFLMVVVLNMIFFEHNHNIKLYLGKSKPQMLIINPILLRILAEICLTKTVINPAVFYIGYTCYIFYILHVELKPHIFHNFKPKILCCGLWNEYNSSMVLLFSKAEKYGDVVVGLYSDEEYKEYLRKNNIQKSMVINETIRSLIVKNLKNVSDTIIIPTEITDSFLDWHGIDFIACPKDHSTAYENDILKCDMVSKSRILFV